MAMGQEACERAIEREFHRVNAVVTRDLAAYPALHRQISDTIDKIEADYQAATDAPPLPPAWLRGGGGRSPAFRAPATPPFAAFSTTSARRWRTPTRKRKKPTASRPRSGTSCSARCSRSGVNSVSR